MLALFTDCILLILSNYLLNPGTALFGLLWAVAAAAKSLDSSVFEVFWLGIVVEVLGEAVLCVVVDVVIVVALVVVCAMVVALVVVIVVAFDLDVEALVVDVAVSNGDTQIEHSRAAMQARWRLRVMFSSFF